MTEEKKTDVDDNVENGDPILVTPPPSRHPSWVRAAFYAAIVGSLPFLPSDSPQPNPVNPLSSTTLKIEHPKGLPPSYAQILEQYPNCSVEQYLEWLGKQFQSPEHLARYMQEYLIFKDDPEGNDNTQSPHETVLTSLHTKNPFYRKKGYMTGDCEDMSIFAQWGLMEMGIQSQVIYLDLEGEGAHAICVWVERNPQGKYVAYCINNGFLSSSRNTEPQGCASIKKALNCAMSDFIGEDGNPCRVNPLSIRVYRNLGGNYILSDTTIFAFDPEVPAILKAHHVDIAICTAVLLSAIAIYCNSRRKKGRNKKEPTEQEKCRRFRQWLTTYLTTFRLY